SPGTGVTEMPAGGPPAGAPDAAPADTAGPFDGSRSPTGGALTSRTGAMPHAVSTRLKRIAPRRTILDLSPALVRRDNSKPPAQRPRFTRRALPMGTRRALAGGARDA